MQIVESFGKNIYIEKQLIGYISRDGLFVRNKKFADIDEEGTMSMNGHEVGYIDEDGYIIVKDIEVGYIDNQNNFIFYKTFKL